MSTQKIQKNIIRHRDRKQDLQIHRQKKPNDSAFCGWIRDDEIISNLN